MPNEQQPFEEAKITINGRELTSGEAMTTRVAVTEFLARVAVPDMQELLGEIGPHYKQAAINILFLMGVVEGVEQPSGESSGDEKSKGG